VEEVVEVATMGMDLVILVDLVEGAMGLSLQLAIHLVQPQQLEQFILGVVVEVLAHPVVILLGARVVKV
jgi:hypothetical protein